MEAVIVRAKEALVGIPEETRGPLPDGNTEYMRPLPGRARMYPETDVPSVEVTKALLDHIRQHMPEQIADKKERFKKEYGLSEELAGGIAYSLSSDTFEDIARAYGNPTLIARTMIGTIVELRRDGVKVENINDAHYKDLFRLVHDGKVAKEAIPGVLTELAKEPEGGVDGAVKRLGLGNISEDEVRQIIKDIVHSRHDFVKEKGEASQSGLMGQVMGRLRGKADGKLINRILKETILEELKS